MAKREMFFPRQQIIAQDAGFFRRLGSFIIDLLLLDIVITAPFSPIFSRWISIAQTSSLSSFTYTNKELAAVFVIMLIFMVYFVLFEYLLGQTLGMMIAKTRTEKGKLWQHVVRNIFFIPLFPFILFWIIEPISIALWKRSVLEHITKTRTMHEKVAIT